MKIIVLVKQVPDTSEERKLGLQTHLLERIANDAVIDEINERALEVALTVKDASKGTEVIALSMGPQNVTHALRKSLALGADSAVHVSDASLVGADAGRTAAVLAAAIRLQKFDLILAGNESTDGRSGSVPAMIAEHLGIPLLGSVSSVAIADGSIAGIRHSEKGALSVHSTIPAIATVTELSPEARYATFKGILTAKRKAITTLSLAELGLDGEKLSGLARCRVLSTKPRATRTPGKKIIDDGSAANELADFLYSNRLI